MTSWAVNLCFAAIPFLAGCAAVPLQQRLQAPPLATVPLKVAGIKDERARFRQIFCSLNHRIGANFPDRRDCENALVRLGGEGGEHGEPGEGPARDRREPRKPRPRTLLFLPGFLGECVRGWGDPFADSYARLEQAGFRVLVAPLEGRSSSRRNASLLNDYLNAQVTAAEELVVIAHSKGAVDFLEATSRFSAAGWLRQTRAFVSVAGAILGSPIADRYQGLYEALFARLPWSDCGPGDGGGLRSITQRERSVWLINNAPPTSLRLFSLAAIPVTQALNSSLAAFDSRLTRIDPRHDGQLLMTDTFLPHSIFLGVADADHWSVALPFNRSARALAITLADQNAYPREVLIEAILAMVEEVISSPP